MVAKRQEERFGSMVDVSLALADFDAEATRWGTDLTSRAGSAAMSPATLRTSPPTMAGSTSKTGSAGESQGSDHPTKSIVTGREPLAGVGSGDRESPATPPTAPASEAPTSISPKVALGAPVSARRTRRHAGRQLGALAGGGVAALLVAANIVWWAASRGAREPRPELADRQGESASRADSNASDAAKRPANAGGSSDAPSTPEARPTTAGGWGPWTMPSNVPPPLVAPFSATAAREGQRAWAEHLKLDPAPRNTLDMPFVLVPPGEFEFNLNPANGAIERTNVVRLRITQPFYLGATEVSVAQFRRFVEDTKHVTDAEQEGKVRVAPTFQLAVGRSWRKPVDWKPRDDEPVVCVSPRDARAFADWLSAKEGVRYRLPSEAEWRFAARAGDTSEYGQTTWGVSYAACDHGNRKLSAEQESPLASVESLEPNPFGLYHVFGNVSEFSDDCRTHPSDLPYARQIETIFATVSSLGGHWAGSTSTPHPLDMRWFFAHDHSANYQGFRLVRELPEVHEAAPEQVGRLWIDEPPIARHPAFVADPTPIRGLRSWTIDTVASRFEPSRLHVTADAWIHWVCVLDGSVNLPFHGADVGRNTRMIVASRHARRECVFDRGKSIHLNLIKTGESPTLHPDERRAFFAAQVHSGYPAVACETTTGRQLGVLYPSLGEGHWLCIGPTGHYRGTEGVERDIVYVAEHLDGTFTSHSLEDFARAFGWQNDPNQATFLATGG